MQNQEVEVPVSATKTSSGMILETRPNHEVVNTVANNITACQIPSTLSQSTQSFEESVAKLDQTNGRVRKISTTILISISLSWKNVRLHLGISLMNPKYF